MIFFDTETTGLEIGSRIIELGSVRVDDSGQVVDTFHRMINPEMPLPADALSVNRITKEMLDAAPLAANVLQEWLDWVGDEQFAVAHFAPYDVMTLSWALDRAHCPLPKVSVIDTWTMAKAIGASENNKLQTLVAHYGIKVEGEAHRAVADCHSCRLYYDIAKTLTKPFFSAWTTSSRYVSPNLLPKHLESLPQCVAEGSPIAFNYTDAAGAKSSRSLIPYGWGSVNGVVQFHGFDASKSARRTFIADRSAPL